MKAILGVRSRAKAFQILDHLKALGYLTYTLDPETKLLTYQITDWVMEYTGEECLDGTVYATPGHGFICMPRDITERLAEMNYKFDVADAWLDLWCHTVFRDYGNAFSFLSPVIQYGKYGSMLTLETLGKRWRWEKTKVWRFFKNHATCFQLYRLPNSYGSVIYSRLYPTCDEIQMPEEESVMRIFRKILICAKIRILQVLLMKEATAILLGRAVALSRLWRSRNKTSLGRMPLFRMSLELALHFLPYITRA